MLTIICMTMAAIQVSFIVRDPSLCETLHGGGTGWRQYSASV